MNSRLLRYWDGPGGAGEVLKLAFPLMLSTSLASVQMFIDRVFLTWYDTEGMAGAMQGGIACYSAMALFLGIMSYVSTFVAQYTGAGRPHRVGPSVWQGLYFATAAGILMLALSQAARPIFNLAGHAPAVRGYEITFFSIMCVGGWPTFLGTVLACFFTGRGKTWTVLWVDLACCLTTVALDYCMIFGRLGFPEMGVAGAAWATVIAEVVRVAIYAVMFLNSRHNELYGTRHAWRPEWNLIVRMVRYGVPNSVQFCLDVTAFAFFLAIVGRMSEVALGATSIVFQLNQLAFMPMVGMGTAVSVLVGRRLGEDRPDLAARSTWTAAGLCLVYMTSIAMAYITLPNALLLPFSEFASAERFAPLHDVAVKLLWFVAFFSLFDTGNIIFSGTLKGAGDTRFVMLMTMCLSILLLVIPSILVVVLGWGLYTAWTFATAYVCILAMVFMFRVLAGKWKHMRVIEKAAPMGMPSRIPTMTGEVEP